MKCDILILTEGGNEKGLGHIARCGALSDALGERGVSSFFLVDAHPEIEPFLTGRQYELCDWINERDRLERDMKNKDAVVIDSYRADKELYEMIAAKIPLAVYFDDENRLSYPGGIVINPAPGAYLIGYPQNQRITYLLGEEYFLLRKPFWDVPKKNIVPVPQTLLITFGAGEVSSFLAGVTGALERRFPGMNKKVVVSKRLEQDVIKGETIEILSDISADRMKDVMGQCDLALSAGGQTLCELLRMGVPTVAVSIASNQIANINGFKAAGAIKYAGTWRDDDIIEKTGTILKKLKDDFSLRQCLSQRGQELIDGQGVRRVADGLIEQIKIRLKEGVDAG